MISFDLSGSICVLIGTNVQQLEKREKKTRVKKSCQPHKKETKSCQQRIKCTAADTSILSLLAVSVTAVMFPRMNSCILFVA